MGLDKRQADIDRLMERLEGPEGPTGYAYPAFLHSLMNGSRSSMGSVDDVFAVVAGKLLESAKSDVYLVDGHAYLRETLTSEFPELALFNLSVDDEFIESRFYPGIRVETKRFATLRSLAPMRRAIKNIKTLRHASPDQAVCVVKLLLGL